MIHLKIARRYARALFDLALEQNVLEQVFVDIQNLKASLILSSDFRSFIHNPIINKEDRASIMRNIFKDTAQPLTLTFILFLVENMRLEILADALDAFEALYWESQNVVHVDIQTALALEPRVVDILVEKLQAHTGKKIKTEIVINEKLIGGFKLKLNDAVYDASFSNQLEKFQASVAMTN